MSDESDGSKIIEKKLLKFKNYESAINYLRSRNLTLVEKKLIRDKHSEFLERLQNIKSAHKINNQILHSKNKT
ncbi:unnamed protein product [Brachionus calyciflorus]|uniref:Uncharacterized protein n=1 Tax=Brachionus calyciflorus TaxID=104777 RepID=A0A814HYX4_9BILA|nr:unnamed protein product [Brachionus calyciflorus]